MDAFVMPTVGHLLCPHMLLTCYGDIYHVHDHVYYVVGDVYRVHIYFNHVLVDIYHVYEDLYNVLSALSMTSNTYSMYIEICTMYRNTFYHVY
jgi:hypothetical protein